MSRNVSEPPPRKPHQRWAKGVPDCEACHGIGRVRKDTFNKDGSPRGRDRWVTCACVPHPTRGYGKNSNAVTFYGAPLVDPVTYPEDFVRPKTRGACEGGARPCVLVGCRYNTYLNVVSKGEAVRLNHGQVPPEDRPPGDSCALDVALEDQPVNLGTRGGATLDRVSQVEGITRERARQIEEEALTKLLKRLPPGHPLRELFEEALANAS